MQRGCTDEPGSATADSGAILITVPRLAEYLGVSQRRVRQMRDDGELIARGRGLIDAAHAFNARVGRMFLPHEKVAQLDKYRVAAVGWLVVRWVAGVGDDDLTDWRAMAAQWGLNPTEARDVLNDATNLLGPARPRFIQSRNTRRSRA